MRLSLNEQSQDIVMMGARKIAFRMKHRQIDTEHILLSLLESNDNPGIQAILRFNPDLDLMRREIIHLSIQSRPVANDLDLESIRMCPTGLNVIESARQEAQLLGHYNVGTEDLLLGLIREGTGIAYRILNKNGITLTRARKEIWQVLHPGETPAVPSMAERSSMEQPIIHGEGVLHGHPDILKIMINERQLFKRTKDLARAISEDYAGREPVFISVLKGSLFFLSDLLREITIPCKFDLMTVSSYGDKTTSSGNVKLVMDLKQDVEGKDIIIVEDIYDSGRTLRYIVDHINSRKPASLKTCVLLNKKTTRTCEAELHYVGFDIPDEFVVGYGLDYGERYRQLPYVGVLKPEVYSVQEKK